MMAIPRAGNLLLDRFSPTDLASMGARAMRHEIGDVLMKSDETPEFVFFPHPDTMVSIVRSTAEGGTVEAAVVGSEGAVSVHVIITPPEPTRNEVVVQNGGELTRIPTGAARDCFEQEASFRNTVLAFTSNLLNQITQNAVCNRLHTIEQRLAKWLLVARDRVSSDEMRLTHEFLAHMLGIHRPGVSIAVDALELDGMIVHARGRIIVRDRDGLLARSCECYAVVHEDLQALRGKLAS